MKRFLVLYMIPASVMDGWKQTSPENRRAAEDKMSREIQAWSNGRSKIFTDPGAGLGKHFLGPDGIVGLILPGFEGRAAPSGELAARISSFPRIWRVSKAYEPERRSHH